MKLIKKLAVVVSSVLTLGVVGANADLLDKILEKGKVKCGVVLDFPPMGYRDAKNKPAGFDVEYCKDLAKALDVELELKSMTFAQRIPALNSGKVDVVIGSTSDTLERAKSAGFTMPYFVFKLQSMFKKGSNIKTFEDLKGKKVTAALSTTPETKFIKNAKKLGWNASDYFSSKSENDTHLALLQGKADAIITTDTTISELLKLDKFKDYVAGPYVPNYDDFVSIITKRDEYGFINYLNLFIHQQVRSGRYAEVYKKFYGDAPIRDLIVHGIYY
ncbi:transporter substrate-binding domain-containing protein [Halarcobacter anaerophilus]|uniref:Amino acid ABC transporter substrate-binding protein n=1 Tax=Halarcobacter anaerophilus TaxID=877500 RepID=A0A4Q0Y118_9BACT|nr:transporter substrate-binding domain-containing protein [Halarcobacter anaerophilus]QDF29087.1 amino acid ABC transporter, periplasmic amino acid-binding protein [Halarcobacter anaerophilus]RXJ63760.1 amino acid ABC transporter substrate-binding protein [Halarcobacter anaerophilus]